MGFFSVLCVRKNIPQMTTIFLLSSTNIFSNPSVFQWPLYIYIVMLGHGENFRSAENFYLYLFDYLFIYLFVFFLIYILILYLYLYSLMQLIFILLEYL